MQESVYLRNGPIDAPSGAHLAPVENELFLRMVKRRHISVMTEITELPEQCQVDLEVAETAVTNSATRSQAAFKPQQLSCFSSVRLRQDAQIVRIGPG